MLYLALLLLPIAAVSGWYAGYKYRSNAPRASKSLPRDYFTGLRYLIDEQPDKAVDIFIKMLEVNSDTVETHLALGSLFRRRGEVNRAIRIHQNLIARPQLAKNQRIQALSELAQDYMRAGVLDRAENLLLELVAMGKNTETYYQYLLNIYEQQKDWDKAIAIAEKLEKTRGIKMQAAIAHYYCELNNPRKALFIDKNCVRASLLQGELYIRENNIKNAIRAYKRVTDQDADYISEIIQPLAHCYEQLGNEAELINYLRYCLAKFPRISVILALAGYLKKHHGDFVAIEFITEQISHYPSLRGLECLTQLYIDNSESNTKRKFVLLQELITKLLAEKPVYQCIHCGFASKSLYWHCPGCKRWNSVKPIHGLEGD
jgi:lipopolysaccharide biosynthesis regulator YciM